MFRNAIILALSVRVASAHGGLRASVYAADAAAAAADASGAPVKCPFLARREAVGSVSRSLSDLESSYVLVSVPLMKNLEDMDYWWLGEGSTDAYGVAKASPSGLEFKSIVVDDAGGTATVELHFLVPRDTSSLDISVYDEDVYTGDDLLGVAALDLTNKCGKAGKSQGCGFSVAVERVGSSWQLWKGWQDITINAGSVDGVYYVDGGAAAARAALKARDVQRAEARTAVFSPADFADYLAKAHYYVAESLGFLIAGLFGDGDVPVSGLYDFQARGSTDGGVTAPGPGPDTTTVIGHALAVDLMGELGDGLESDDLYRRNELGVQFFNSAPWPEKSSKSIGLGDDWEDHELVRPMLNRMVGPAVAADPATLAWIEAASTAFFDHSSPGASVATDDSVKVWTTKLLHRIHLGIIMTDAEAEAFIGVQFLFLTVAAVPEEVAAVTSAVLGFDEALAYKAGQLVKYEAALEAKYPADYAAWSPRERTLVASGVMDSLLFAGGLSVPSAVAYSFAVLYSAWGRGYLGDHFVLTEANVMPFVLETTRRFAPVSGFPFWDRDTNQHVIIDLLMANADKAAWGDDAHDFVLRDLSEYEAKHVGWADFALKDGDIGHPASRKCPAKDLSLAMISGLLRGFMRSGGAAAWTADVAPSDVTMNGYQASTLTLTRASDFAAETDADEPWSYWLARHFSDGAADVAAVGGGLAAFLRESALQFLGDVAAQVLGLTGDDNAFGAVLRKYLNKTDAGKFGGRFDLVLELLETLSREASSAFANGATAASVASPAVTYPTDDAATWTQGLFSSITTPGLDPTVDSSLNDVFSSDAFQDAVASLGGIQGGPAPMAPESQGVFPADADHGAWVRDHLGADLYPSARELRDWSSDYESDAAFAQFFFAGVGQSMLTKDGDGFVALMDYASTVDVKEGAGRYGGDVYFGADAAVTRIVYEGVEYTPASGAAWAATKAKCRGTAVALATAVDHLLATHLTFGNGLAWAVPTLPPDHPMRRLLWTHVYKTTSINLVSAAILTSEGGLLHRGWALSKAGFVALFDYAKASHPLFKWATVPDRFAATGMPAGLLPLHEDGLDFYGEIATYVERYVALYYASDAAVAADADLQTFFAVLNEHALNRDLPAALTRATVVDVLATYVFYVTGYHAHSGSLGAEGMSPELAPQSWYASDDAAAMPVSPPNNFLHVAITMSATSALQLSITGDACAIEKSCGFAGKAPYFHDVPAGAADQPAIPGTGYPTAFAGVAREAEAVAANKAFVDSLLDLQAVIEARNGERHACAGGKLPAVCRAYSAFDVSFVEASVAI